MDVQAITTEGLQVLDSREFYNNSEVTYILPKDTDELSRLHKQHLVFRSALQRNFAAPLHEQLKQGITVLDSGCGPAAWTFDVTAEYPNSRFYEKRPDNCEFVVGNIAEHIPYPDNTFDYIHQRFLLGGLTSKDWENTLKELYRVLKPGGYIELVELDLHYLINIGQLWAKITAGITMMFNTRGIPLRIYVELEYRLVKAGFINPLLKISQLPLNHGSKTGEMLWDDCKHGHLNLRPILAKMNSEWGDVVVYENYLDACGVEAEEKKTCVNHYACYAQKPLQ